jgi:integrase
VPRKKGEGEGTLQKRGKVWWARWVQYDADGKRHRPEKIIGTVAELPTKRDARERLNAIIRETAGKTEPIRREPTFGEVWTRYATTKTPKWSRANQKTVNSIFRRAVLPTLGDRLISQLTFEPLQNALNQMAEMTVGKTGMKRGYSRSAMVKALRYIRAVFTFAIEEDLITKNPTRKLQIPAASKPCERFYTLDEVRRLLSATEGRERIILQLMIMCGLRPAEVFALRDNDIEPGKLRIDEAVKDAERGTKRIGDTKTVDANAFVALTPALERDLRAWAATQSNGLLFPTDQGTAWRIGNYLKRVLKPLAASVEPPILDMTHQALRRTFATHFQHHGSIKDTQSQLRHADPETTLRYYQKEIPDSVRDALESFESEIYGVVQ